MRRQPLVDLVVGPQSYHRLPQMEAKVRDGAKALDTDFPLDDKFDTLRKRRQGQTRPDRVPDRAGRLRQVLRLLRGALYPRGRGQPPGGRASSKRRANWWIAACAKSPCWART